MSSAALSVPSFVRQEVLDELFSDFPLSPKDLLIVSYPKSGTTWTQHIVNLLSAGKLVVHLPKHFPNTFTLHGIQRMLLSLTIITINALSFLTLVEIGMIFFEYFLKGDVNYGSWFDHILGWWSHKDAENILFLKYEDMKRDLPGAVRSISQFMGYDLDQATIESIAEQSSFESMKANPLANPDLFFTYKVETNSTPPFLRKGVVDDWKNHFSEEQSSILNAEYTKRMGGIGLNYCS
uniref:Sulfotransferase domain-containing protein n=1 Tax=Amphimedon queenslandica TaxID=400682 RepID=A0A1X7UF11_AMPQE